MIDDVLIRHARPEDEDEFVELRRASREHLERWEPLPRDRDAFGPSEFARFLATTRTERSQRFFVCRVADGRIVGQSGLGEIIRGPLEQAFLGYWAGEPYEGRGYMSRGVRLVLDHAFGALGLHRVEANIQPQNARSIALARRLGFRKEGFSLRYLCIQGVWADHERWAITAEELGR